MKKFIVVVGICLLSQMSWALEKAVIVIEKRSLHGVEQMGLSVKGNKINIISNSNFLAKNYPYYYGLFEVEMNSTLRQDLSALIQKEKEQTKEEVYVSPHATRVYVNGEMVPLESIKNKQAYTLIMEALNSKKTKLKDGVILKNNSQVKKVNCEQPKTNNICVFKYGFIHE